MRPLLLCHALLVPALCGSSIANPVTIPYSNNFDQTDASDFFSPTGNGYNWGWDWRAGNLQNWVSAPSQTATATMQVRALGGAPATATDFICRVTVDPVELVGTGHSIGFGACGSDRVLSSFYLADVKPATNTIRLVKVSGGNTFLVPERAIQNLALTDRQPFELELKGASSAGSLTLEFTVRKDGQSDTVSAFDTSVLTGSHFGLRTRNGGGGARFEVHFDNYELRPAHLVAFTSEPALFAPVGEPYAYTPLSAADPPGPASAHPVRLPSWTRWAGDHLEGTPGPQDLGPHLVILAASSAPATAQQEFVITVPAPTEPCISEFMADNDDTLADQDGQASDWIELCNPTSTDRDLSGWFLTDDPLVAAKWPLPDGTLLPAFSFRLFFASGKALPDHANFALTKEAGGYLALVRPDGTVAHSYQNYPRQREDISYGLFGDYATAGFLLTPTPLAPNTNPGYHGFVDDTTFTVDRGLFDTPFTTVIACETPGAAIVHTLDGSTPTLYNGALTPSPDPGTPPTVHVLISSTTTLRAAAFKAGLAPSNVDTQTYLFLADIRSQNSDGAAPPGWPSGSVNGQVFDYGMDPEVLGPLSMQDFTAAMTDIDTISLVTDLAHLIDPDTGIWVNAENRGPQWERPVSLELIPGDGSRGFQIDAGVRVRGGWSRQSANPKHAFHLYFRQKYGAGKLHYPLFGLEGADRFDRLDLRCSQGRSWHWSHSPDATFNRDVFGRHLQRDMGQPYARSRYYHLYLNGLYFGLFQSQERTDKFFGDSYFGGGEAGWDVMKTRTRPHRVEALDGDPDAWGRLYDAAVAGFLSDSAYFAVQGLDPLGNPHPAGENLLDLDNLIDYMLAIFFTGQSDGPVNLGANVPKNFFAVRPRDGRFGFRFFVHDNEDSLQSLEQNNTVSNDTGERLTHFNPKWLHQRLAVNGNYRRRFGDRAHRHLFNHGALAAASGAATFESTAATIEKAILGESARWGDFRVSPPYTPATWQNAVAGKIEGWIPLRGPILLHQLRAAGLYPALEAPIFSPHGGRLTAGGRVTVSASAEIHYTLDGTDPIDAGPSVLVLGADPAQTLLPAGQGGWMHFASLAGLSTSDLVNGHPAFDNTDWKHPAFDDSGWQSVTMPIGYGEVGFPPVATTVFHGPDPANRFITYYARRQFNVAGADSFTSVTLAVRRDDGIVAYLNGSEVARSNLPLGTITPATIAPTYATGPDETTFFTFAVDPAELREGANTLAIELHNATSSNTDLVLDAELRAAARAVNAIGLNSSATLKARAFDETGWSALNEATFLTTTPASPSNLRITEIHYNPGGSGEELEFLELRNVSDETIHLDGVALIRGVSFAFPAGTTLAPGAFLLLVKDRTAFEAAYGSGLPIAGEYGGNLSNGGEELILVDQEGAILQRFAYGDRHPWSALPDGGGPSLVFLAGDPADPASWRPSATDNGNPGASDALTFAGDPDGEDARNGLRNLLNYAIGGPRGLPRASIREHNGESLLSFHYRQVIAADDVIVHPETSHDLLDWTPAEQDGFLLVTESLVAPGILERHYERSTPSAPAQSFLRLRVEAR